VFKGGDETNAYLQALGFAIALKGGDAPPVSTPISHTQLDSLRHELLENRQLYTWKELQDHPSLPPPVPGVYAWFFKVTPKQVPTDKCFKRQGMILLYVGISPGRPKSSETLRSRLRYHYAGNAAGSTLRLTLGCLLEDELGTILKRSGGRLVFGPAEDRLSSWMADNTAVSWVELQAPRRLEEFLLKTYDLPLNMEGNRGHPFYDQLCTIRRRARERAARLADLKTS
jgi:hypothetical protein